MPELTPDRVRAKADGLVARINAKGANKNEAAAAVMALGKLHAAHPEIFKTQPATAASLLDTVQKVREAVADPNVQATVASATDFLGKIVDLASRAKR